MFPAAHTDGWHSKGNAFEDRNAVLRSDLAQKLALRRGQSHIRRHGYSPSSEGKDQGQPKHLGLAQYRHGDHSPALDRAMPPRFGSDDESKL